MEHTIRIHSFETFGTHEWPGIRFVTFLQGCHFRCMYCHNPDTQALDGGKEYTIDQICAMVERSRPYFGTKGWFTASGWEPLIQAKALVPLYDELRRRGIHTALDTNGHVWTPEVRELVENHVDLVLLDVKHIDSVGHEQVTGFDNKNVLEFAKFLHDIKKPTWIRYVLVPEHNDAVEHLEEFGEVLSKYENIERVEILPYHTLGVHKYEALGMPYKLHHINPPSNEDILSAKRVFEKYFSKVVVR